MKDNLELIKPLLKFESKDDYYFLQILVRKKDRDSLPFKIGGSNNNSRLIKSYNVTSIKYLEDRYEEIKAMCGLFKARAMICLNKRSFHSSSHQMLVRLAQSIQSQNYKNQHSWNNVSSQYHPIKDKTWIIDIDKEDISPKKMEDVVYFMNNQKPEGNKIIEKIPSKSGFHYITKPFDLRGFDIFNLDVHKNNPTNLYIPD